jgi:hypothetical protein
MSSPVAHEVSEAEVGLLPVIPRQILDRNTNHYYWPAGWIPGKMMANASVTDDCEGDILVLASLVGYIEDAAVAPDVADIEIADAVRTHVAVVAEQDIEIAWAEIGVAADGTAGWDESYTAQEAGL